MFRNHSQVSQDCLDAIFVTAQHQSQMDQNFIEANVQGHLATMPAGEARFSAGATTRSYDYYYYFDPMQQECSFNDNLLGFPADNSKGSTSVNEVYGEFFSSEPPARSAVAVAALPRGARVEVEAIAARHA